jgi:5-methylcytosine-specific restriction endonuclease McrA
MDENHSNVLDARIVLVLNRGWRAIGQIGVRKAFENLFSESHGRPAALALDIQTGKDEDGNEMLVNANPVNWETWINLPVRPEDLYVQTANRKIRVPTVIVAANYDKIPIHMPRLTKQAVFERDGGVCQYTGEYVGKSGGNIDHVNPRDRGGKDSFENLVWCKKDVNSKKSNRLPHEAGLRLIRSPKAPPAMPRVIRRNEAKHSSWIHFLDI